jgi:hypothetical protein
VSRQRQRWVVIPNWGKFQHYRDRNPPWVKVYTELLNDPDWLALPPGTRSLLVQLWLVYASSRGRVPLDTRSLSRRLNQRVTIEQLESLSHAGFLHFSASKPASTPLATRARTRETEAETDPPAPQRGARGKLTSKDLRRYTGCRYARGTHASTYVRDPLGTDRPPDNWPHPRPTQAEVEQALNGTQPEQPELRGMQ